MKKHFYIFSFLLLFFSTLSAQTNCGRGVFTVVATRIQYTGGDGADNCDDSGLNCTFEIRFTPTSDAGSGAAGPGCQSFSDDNDFSTNNLLVAQHMFNAAGCPVLPNNLTLAYNLHEDDSAFGNCTVNGSDDDNCNGSQSVSTLGAFASPGTPQNATVSCGAWIVTFQLTWTPLYTGGTACANMQPICTSTGALFELPTTITGQATGSNSSSIDACVSVDGYSSPVTGNYMGCLGVGAGISGTAGAVWWYLKIQNGGNLDMQLSAPADVDFILWGPYSNLNEALALCGKHRAHTDCSFNISNVENVNIANATTGEIYVLYVLNYAGVAQNASLIKTGGTATTDCSLLGDCLIRGITVQSVGACNSANDTYSATVRITFENPPALPTSLNVNGQVFALTATDRTNGFKDVTLTGLPANGAPTNVLAYFTTDISCVNTKVDAWIAPAPCDPCPAKSGNW